MQGTAYIIEALGVTLAGLERENIAHREEIARLRGEVDRLGALLAKLAEDAPEVGSPDASR